MARYEGPVKSKSQARYLWANGLMRTFVHDWEPKGLYRTLPDSVGPGTSKNSRSHGLHHGTANKTKFSYGSKGHAKTMIANGKKSSRKIRH